MDIQKLATEMGLSCITTYKLDALKAVRRNECDDVTNLSYSKDNSGMESSNLMMEQVEKIASIASEGLSTDKASKISGREILLVCFGLLDLLDVICS